MRVKLTIFISALLISHLSFAGNHQATADLVDSHGNSVGKATFTQKGSETEIQVDVKDLSPGKHGIHIHENGKCDPPDFKSAGGHFHAGTEHHGLENPKGPHLGDLPNLEVKDDGTAKQTFKSTRISLKEGEHPLLKSGGTSLVIHAKPDDEKSDPSGQSGDRIACGIIK